MLGRGIFTFRPETGLRVVGRDYRFTTNVSRLPSVSSRLTVVVHADGMHARLTGSDGLMQREKGRPKGRDAFLFQFPSGLNASTRRGNLDA